MARPPRRPAPVPARPVVVAGVRQDQRRNVVHSDIPSAVHCVMLTTEIEDDTHGRSCRKFGIFSTLKRHLLRPLMRKLGSFSVHSLGHLQIVETADGSPIFRLIPRLFINLCWTGPACSYNMKPVRYDSPKLRRTGVATTQELVVALPASAAVFTVMLPPL